MFSFHGRINRVQWWCISLLWWFLSFTFGILLALIIVSTMMDRTEAGDFGVEGTIALVTILAIAAYPLTALAVKRLNDRNRSYWLLIVFWTAPALMLYDRLTDISLNEGVDSLIFTLMLWVSIVWTIIEFGVLKGRSGADQSSPSPLASASDLSQ